MSSLEVEYIYHEHTGDATLGTGCYSKPIYHQHTDSCYGTCGGQAVRIEFINNGWGAHYQCQRCSRSWDAMALGAEQWTNPVYMTCNASIVTCNLTNTIIGYELGCNKTNETVEQAIINFN